MKNEAPDELKEALSKAADILTFADNTEKKLREKLKRKGFEDETIDKAVLRLQNAGLLDDERLMLSNVESIANSKLYGRGRIKIELLKKGFQPELINGNFEKCTEDIDFKNNCYKLVKRKGLVLKFIDRETRNKVTAALVRYGYNYAEIKFALEKVLKENEEN